MSWDFTYPPGVCVDDTLTSPALKLVGISPVFALADSEKPPILAGAAGPAGVGLAGVAPAGAAGAAGVGLAAGGAPGVGLAAGGVVPGLGGVVAAGAGTGPASPIKSAYFLKNFGSIVFPLKLFFTLVAPVTGTFFTAAN